MSPRRPNDLFVSGNIVPASLSNVEWSHRRLPSLVIEGGGGALGTLRWDSVMDEYEDSIDSRTLEDDGRT